MAETNGQEPAPELDFPQFFGGKIVPTDYNVASNPDTGKLLIRFIWPGGVLDVDLESGDGAEKLADGIKRANAKAKSGLTVADASALKGLRGRPQR